MNASPRRVLPKIYGSPPPLTSTSQRSWLEVDRSGEAQHVFYVFPALFRPSLNLALAGFAGFAGFAGEREVLLTVCPNHLDKHFRTTS